MLLFLKAKRNKMLKENKILTYFAYALGEIGLVVVGILLAIQIDDWNRDRELNQQELASYELIIIDLKRDSALFSNYQRNYTLFLDTYFKIHRMTSEGGSFQQLVPDLVVSNVQFNPVTKNNHQITIEKLRDSQIRERINDYFGGLNLVAQATQEFNNLITDESRPYLLSEKNIFNYETVFDDEDRTFPPFKGASTIDTLQMKKVMMEPKFLPILAQLRMSMGFYLASLERSISENNKLIKELQQKIK